MKITTIFAGIALLLIMGLGYYLRNDNYAAIPYPGESLDEYSFSWVGLSLIETGVPIGTSGIPGYKDYDFRYISVDQIYKETAKGEPIPINTPWFDHPPALGLVTGGYAYMKGARVFEETLISFIRKPMIVLGAVSVLLLFLFLLKVFSYKEAIIGSLIYAVSPLAIIGSRTVQAENLLIPVFLASLITTYFYIEYKKPWLFWVAAIMAGTALLVKLSGISVVLSNLFILLYFSKDSFKKTLPSLLTFGIASMSFLIFFLVYGAAYDFNQFIAIFASNGDRFYGIGSKAFYDLLTTTKITNLHYLTDGWFLAGWVAAAMLFIIPSEGKRKEMFIIIPLVCYLIVFVLFGSEAYGWYRYPFMPFIFAAIARVLVLALKNPVYSIPSFLILLVPTGVNISKIISIESFQNYAGIWKWSFVGLLILLLIVNLERIPSRATKTMLHFVILGMLVFSVYLSMEYFWIITPEYWRSSN